MGDEETLQDYDDEMAKLFEGIRDELKLLKPVKGKSKLTEAERSSKIAYVNSRIQRCRQVHRSYKVDLRNLDKATSQPYEAKWNEYKETINTLIQDLNWIQENELLGPGGQTARKKDLDAMTADEVLNEAKKTQAKSKDSLDTTLKTIEDSKQVASDTASKLHQQTEQIKKIDKDLDEMQSDLQIASKQLRSFARRLATDKIIMAFILLIVIGIIIAIVYRAVKSGQTAVPASLANVVNFTSVSDKF